MGVYTDLQLRKVPAAMMSEQEIANAVDLLRLSVRFDKESNHQRGSGNSNRRAVPIPNAVRAGLFRVTAMHFFYLTRILEEKVTRSVIGDLNQRTQSNQAFGDAQQVTLGAVDGAFGSTAWEPKKTLTKDEVQLIKAHLREHLQQEQIIAQSGIEDKGRRRQDLLAQVKAIRADWKRLGGE